MNYTLSKSSNSTACLKRGPAVGVVIISPTALVAVFVQLEYGTPDQRSFLHLNRESLDCHCQVDQTRISLQHASHSLAIAVTFDADRYAVDTASPTGTPPLPTPAPMTPSPTGNQTQQQTSHVHTTGSVHFTDRSNLEVHVRGFRLWQIFRNHVHL